MLDDGVLKLAKRVARDGKARKAELAQAFRLLTEVVERQQTYYRRGRRLTDLIEDIQRDP